MNQIIIEQASPDKLEQLGVFSWSIWEKEVSSFPWTYESTEMCYILAGDVIVTPNGGASVCFRQGDLVTLPAGMSCFWEILSPVKKHYIFA